MDSPTHIAMQEASTGVHNDCVRDAARYTTCLKSLSNLLSVTATDYSGSALKQKNTIAAAKLFVNRYKLED